MPIYMYVTSEVFILFFNPWTFQGSKVPRLELVGTSPRSGPGTLSVKCLFCLYTVCIVCCLSDVINLIGASPSTSIEHRFQLTNIQNYMEIYKILFISIFNINT